MSKIRLHGSSSGYTEIAPVAASGNNTLTLPNDGTIISKDSNGAVGVTSITVGTGVTAGDGRVTATSFVGAIPAASIVGVATAGFERSGGFGNFVKLSEATGTDLGGALIFDNLDTATYRAFKLYFAVLPDSTADGYYAYFRFRTGGASGADDTSSHYSYTYSYGYQNDGNSTIARIDGGFGGLTHTVGGQAAVEGMRGVLDIMLCRSGDSFNTGGGGSAASGFIAQHNEVENWRGGYTHILYNNSSTVNHTGFKIFMGSGGSEVGGFDNYKYALYGVTG